MSLALNIDTSQIAELEKLFAQLPSDIRHRVAARAMKRMAQRGNTAIVRDIAALTQIQAKHVRKRTRTYYDAGDLSLDTNVNSSFIPLIEIGGDRMKRALRRKAKGLRGSARTAFLATIKHDRSIFRRVGPERGPVEEQFGPNPAHAVGNAPERYQALLLEILRSDLIPRVEHEMKQALKA